MSKKKSNAAKEKKLLATVWAHDWGFLIPCNSGVVWQQQTGGIMCYQVFMEGVFIPLHEPHEFDPENPEVNKNLLRELEDANYRYKPTEDIWRRINASMHFDFEEVDNPKPGEYPDTQEGFMWIRLTKFEPGWGHGDWVRDLIGRVMVLIYPNCD